MATEQEAIVTPPTPEVATPLPPLDADNVREHFKASLARRDSVKADEPAKTSDTAAAAVVSPAPAAAPSPAPDVPDDWGETGLATDHGFLRGRKPDEVAKAFRNAQDKIRKQGEELAQLRRPQTQQHAATDAGTLDERLTKLREEYAITQYVDPDRNFEVLTEINQLLYEKARDKDRREETERSFIESGKYAMEAAAEEIAASNRISVDAARDDIIRLQNDIRMRAQKAFDDALGGSSDPEVVAAATQAWRDVWRDKKTFLELHAEIFGSRNTPPVAPIVVPTVTQKTAPPGARSVAPQPARSANNVTLGPDRERTVKRLADIVGLNEDSTKSVRERQASRMRG